MNHPAEPVDLDTVAKDASQPPGSAAPDTERLHLHMPIDVRSTSLAILALLACLVALHLASPVVIPLLLVRLPKQPVPTLIVSPKGQAVLPEATRQRLGSVAMASILRAHANEVSVIVSAR